MSQNLMRFTSEFDRTPIRVNFVDTTYDGDEIHRPETVLLEANALTSKLANGNHAPVIDIDFPVYLVPSTTPGHSHLYVEREITWRQYKRLLRAMYGAGIIEKGYLTATLHRGYSTVRLPWIKKGVNE